MKNGLSPIKLRAILLISIAALIMLSAAGFWLFKDQLGAYATSVSKDAKKADVSDTEIATLQNLKIQLEEDKVAVNRTKNIVAESKSYAYQTQIINDIDTYAKTSGVTIAGYGFASDIGVNGAAAATAAPQADAVPTPAGLKTTSITITVVNPVKYESIMRFIHSIEANLTKMQLTGVSLRQDAGNGGGSVTVDPLTVEVYIK